MDESSSTGENLLDANQPVFVLAGLHMKTAEASELLRAVQADLPATHGEPKYTSLANTDRGREALLRTFESIPNHSVATYAVHKPLMVIGKMVDLLLEEFFHSVGYDMHADGSAVAMTHMIYFVAPVLGDSSAYNKMLQVFIDAVRYRRRASIDDLFAAIANYRETCDPQWAETVEMLELCRSEADELAARVSTGDMRDCLDPAIPSLLPLCSEFAERVGAFRLVHDRSNAIARQRAKLLALHLLPDPTHLDKNLPPLPASTIEFSDSTMSPQLQIVDWIAGATRQWSTRLVTGHDDTFARRLEPYVEPWLTGALWPDQSRVAG